MVSHSTVHISPRTWLVICNESKRKKFSRRVFILLYIIIIGWLLCCYVLVTHTHTHTHTHYSQDSFDTDTGVDFKRPRRSKSKRTPTLTTSKKKSSRLEPTRAILLLLANIRCIGKYLHTSHQPTCHYKIYIREKRLSSLIITSSRPFAINQTTINIICLI